MNLKRMKSIIVVSFMVIAGLVILIQVKTPSVAGELYHAEPPFGPGARTSDEEAYGAPYDRDGDSANKHVLWGAVDNPHIIRDTYWIEPGYSLTIEDGCEIRFDQGTGLLVQGNLTAMGIPSQIKFTSNLTVKNPGDWERILVDGGAIDLYNCEIEYATDAVYLQNIPQGTSISLGGSDIHHNSNYGVYLNNVKNPSPMVVFNHMYNCSYGVYSLSSSTRILNNEIFNNTYGVYLGIVPGIGHGGAILEDNIITNNKIDGAMIEGEASGFLDNRISNNGRHGINATPHPITGFRPAIYATRNFITNNLGKGVSIFNCTSTSTNIFDANYISNNSEEGIYVICDLGAPGKFDSLNNDILNNSIGIFVKSEDPLVRNNYIASNKEQGIYAEAGADLRIEGGLIENFTNSGCGIELDNSHAKITGTTIRNFSYAIKSNSSDFEMYRSTIEDWDLAGILALSASTGFVENSTMSSSASSHLDIAQGSQITTLNTTFDQNKVLLNQENSKLTVKWFLHVNVTDTLANPIPNASIWIEDYLGYSPDQKYSADSEGYARWLVQTEYTAQDTDGDMIGERTHYTPHDVTAWNETLIGYAQVNMDESKEINIILGTPYFEIPLSFGWNLISLPLNQSTTDISSVLSSISGNWDVVWWYNASIGRWHSTNDDLNAINHTMGFWIFMNTADTLTVTGTIPNSTSIQLYKGWNLVGNPLFSVHEVDDCLGNITHKYEIVQGYDSWDKVDPWKHYHIDKPTNFNDLTYMRNGRGYWLYVKENCVWEVSNF